MVDRQWKGERDWWLDHFYQWSPGQRRNCKNPMLTSTDYLAIPLPFNMPTPLAPPCLIWRWALAGNGYGSFKGRGAHVVGYEQSREMKADYSLNILHLCHRPYCVQPAHLYQGTAKDNGEDRTALQSELHMYSTWDLIGHRHQKAMTEYYWPAPSAEWAVQPLVQAQPLECPHSFIRSAGACRLCANCGESSSQSLFGRHRRRCDIPALGVFSNPPCRCLSDPCCCQRCLRELLGPAQRAHEKAGGSIEGPLYRLLPELLQSQDHSVPKEDMRRLRAYVATLAQTDYPSPYTG